MLAKTDLGLFSSALVISRTAFEMGVKVVWMLQSEIRWEHEARWLRNAKNKRNSEFNFYNQYLNFQQTTEKERDSNDYRSINQLKNFTMMLPDYWKQKFPGKYDQTKPVPNMKDMLEELGILSQLTLYIRLSICSWEYGFYTNKQKRLWNR